MKIFIALPPFSLQERIANEVQKRKERAKRLKGEAIDLLEKARREVEELIEKK